VTTTEAKRIIEALRTGIPVPDGFVREFTVGRTEEIAGLMDTLSRSDKKACLLNANYGSGKTQMLRFLREYALEQGYAVALVTCDCKAGLRSNRMDQVLGAVCKNLEFPGDDRKGVLPFLWAVLDRCLHTPFGKELSNNGAWRRSEVLQSPAMYVAIRACRLLTDDIQNLLEDWLQNPYNYKGQRKLLYEKLVSGFRDPRSEKGFYIDGVFCFDLQGYDQSCKALADLDTLAKESGMKGLVLLIDEFEDFITNMRNIEHEERAMVNLFGFNEGKFSGHSFFAVTPEFVNKCVVRLRVKGRTDFEFRRFKSIEKFEMSPLDAEHILELLKKKIIPTHGRAYGWKPRLKNDAEIMTVIKWAATSPDRTRQIVKGVVKQLDKFWDERQA